jgi:hypothetical protein
MDPPELVEVDALILCISLEDLLHGRCILDLECKLHAEEACKQHRERVTGVRSPRVTSVVHAQRPGPISKMQAALQLA